MADIDYKYFDPDTSQIEICLFKELDSTHKFALQQNWRERMSPNHLIVVFAGEQMQGMGSHNRIWRSSGIDFHANLVFLIDKTLPFSLLAAVTVCQFLNNFTREKYTFRLKWPNDIYVKHRKIGGCLSYMRRWDDVYWVTIGIGINFNLSKDTMKEIDQPVISLKTLLNNKGDYSLQDLSVCVQDYADLFWRNLYWYHRVGAKQFFKDCHKYWLYLGDNITIFDEDRQQWLNGVFEDVSNEGCLLLKPLSGGESVRITNGTKIHLTEKQMDKYEGFVDNLL